MTKYFVKALQAGLGAIVAGGGLSALMLSLVFLPVRDSLAATSGDFAAVPPMAQASVKPNVLIILDNSTSMNDDVDGNPVGSQAANSRSEIARRAMQAVITDNQASMRFGLMAYDQKNVFTTWYGPTYMDVSYCSGCAGDNPQRQHQAPVDPNNNAAGKIYYNISAGGYGGSTPWYCYYHNGTSYIDQSGPYPTTRYPFTCCSTKKIGTMTNTQKTPPNQNDQSLQTNYGYGGYCYQFDLSSMEGTLADMDPNAAQSPWGQEMVFGVTVPAWQAGITPGKGRLHVNIADTDTSAQKTLLAAKLATQRVDATITDDGPTIPIRNGGDTPIPGTLQSALNYFQGQAVTAAPGVTITNPILAPCQKNYVILVTDGMPTTMPDQSLGTLDQLVNESVNQLNALHKVSNPAFSGTTFDVKTFVVGFALTGSDAAAGNLLNALAAAGGTSSAYNANDEAALNSALKGIFQQISQEMSSGTAAVINTNSRNGEGAMFMSSFYPAISDTDKRRITWAGGLSALFLDKDARLREDSNGNGILDEDTDRIVEFHTDSSGNSMVTFLDPVAAKSEITELTMPPAPASLVKKHFLINSTQIGNVYREYYVWFNVDKAGSPDVLPTTQQAGGSPPIGIEVALNTGDDAAAIATKTAKALNANASFLATASGAKVQVKNLLAGPVVDASVGTAGASIIITVIQQGAGRTGESPMDGTRADIHFLWDSTNTLAYNSGTLLSDDAIGRQRSYATADGGRYIFTFVDADKSMAAKNGEQVAFESPTVPTAADLTDASKLSPYVLAGMDSNLPTLTNPSTGATTNLNVASPALQTEFRQKQTKRVIDYIRGVDQAATTLTNGSLLPAFRSRQIKRSADAAAITWRLGDIVNSNPLTVDKPSQNYHQIYGDNSYTQFIQRYENRRTVVYVGANDGMLHAFNAGFYENRLDKNKGTTGNQVVQYLTQPYVYKKDANGYRTGGLTLDNTISAHQLGAELWAYVPYNLLPHLYWLTESPQNHVYYVDLEPTSYDVKIFADDADHPGGWGTILVGGMRFGGGAIDANIGGATRTMSSAYFILDITNPEKPPTVLAEIALPYQGFTVSMPALIIIKNRGNEAGGNNLWALAFGNGPVSSTCKADRPALDSGLSKMPARIFIINLNELAQNQKLRTLNGSGNWQDYSPTTPGQEYAYQIFRYDNKAYVADIVASDFNLDYKTDALYFGTVQDMSDATTTTPSLSGKLRRVVIDNNADPAQWHGDSVLIDLTKNSSPSNRQPITAAASTSTDEQGNAWVYFGTGRYLFSADLNIHDRQSIYGIKEPKNPDGTRNWGEVSRGGLYNSTNILVSSLEKDENQEVSGTGTGSNMSWQAFNDYIKNNYQGWFVDLAQASADGSNGENSQSAERIISQPAVFGGLVAFTSFIPTDDPCSKAGESFLWGINYLTGTASNQNVMGTDGSYYASRISLGTGLASRVSVRQNADGSAAIFAQRSDGSIFSTTVQPPGISKSGRVGWEVKQ